MNEQPQEIVVVSESETPGILKIGIAAGIAGLIYFLFFRGGSGNGKSGTSEVSAETLTFLLPSRESSKSDGPIGSASERLMQIVDGKPVAPSLSVEQIAIILKGRSQTEMKLRVTGGTVEGDITFVKEFLHNAGIGVTTIDSHTVKSGSLYFRGVRS